MSTDDIKSAILSDLRASFGELKCVGSERLVRLGISMTQLHVMHLLERHGEIAMRHLAEMLDVSDSAATGLIDRIEERGFVERIRVPEDRRIVLVRITPAGRQTLEDVEASRADIMATVLDQIDPSQLEGIATAMAALRVAFLATHSDPTSGAHHSHQPQGRE
ncbi:MAG: MarR family winged helix-turn-helix transcriptional regulator [Chloroflexota bacterium]